MNPSWACAQMIIAELVAAGVTDAVLAPGSRNAPLAYALQAADGAGQLRLHVRVDERSAAFLALGLAKGSGRAVPVVTTSGSAVGNLMPAVMEASHAHVPLMIISADRPASMINIGANQTTDQVHLFGRLVRADARVSSESAAHAAWGSATRRLLAEALGLRSRRPGPVHLNVELSEPLMPTPDPAPAVHAMTLEAPPTATPVPLPGTPRTVLVVGDATPTEGARAVALAEAAGVPLLAEPSSNARRGRTAIATYRLLLGGELGRAIERVVVLGRPTLSRAVSALLRREDVALVVVAAHADWVDPGHTARHVVDAVSLEPGDPAWLAAWQAADAETSAGVEELIGEATSAAGPRVPGLALARSVAASVTGEQVLVLGSSSPIRDIDLAPILDEPPRVFANRGLAGIDGTISTAAGVALATGAPTTLAVGDLAFLHEIGGLLVPASEPQPRLRIVVGHDNGGAIFATLEQGEARLADSFERIFGTPHDTDLAAIARGFGARVVETSSLDDVQRVLADPPGPGVEVLLVHVDRHHRRHVNDALNALTPR